MLSIDRNIHDGQTLIEVLIAIGVIGLIIVGILQASTISVKNSTSSQQMVLAARYATEASEWLRSQNSTRGWAQFKSDTPVNNPGKVTRCLLPVLQTPSSDPTDTTYASSYTPYSASRPHCSPIDKTNLIRWVTIDNGPGSTVITFDITIEWPEGSNWRSSTFTTQISNINTP
jgi:type II secretory pathway pseudopilin PulG